MTTEQAARETIDRLLVSEGWQVAKMNPADNKSRDIVIFMRAVKSRTFFEQMKGRGVRVINPADLQRAGWGPRDRRQRAATPTYILDRPACLLN